MGFLEKLCELGSPASAASPPDVQRLHHAFGENAAEAIARVLNIKNGFRAFDNSLHVLSDMGSEVEPSIYRWNHAYCWRLHYGALAPEGVSFAEDVFGNQFVWQDNAVLIFDAESGQRQFAASTLEQWADKIIREPSIWTGQRTAAAWQAAHGPLAPGHRLVPKMPLVRGRDVPIGSVEVVASVEAMQTRGARARALYPRGRLS